VSVILLLCAASSLVMTGVIWFVQVVHYPLFDGVPADAWPAYHDRHTTRVTVVVAGPMLVELGTAVSLVLDRPAGVPAGLTAAGLACAAAAWALTLAVASPDHGRLAGNWDPRVARRLVTAGWGRTAAWTAHAALTLVMLGLSGA
jgi:hypothetical protein